MLIANLRFPLRLAIFFLYAKIQPDAIATHYPYHADNLQQTFPLRNILCHKHLRAHILPLRQREDEPHGQEPWRHPHDAAERNAFRRLLPVVRNGMGSALPHAAQRPESIPSRQFWKGSIRQPKQPPLRKDTKALRMDKTLEKRSKDKKLQSAVTKMPIIWCHIRDIYNFV